MSAPALAEIRTERLTMRPIEVGDVASFAYVLADPEVVRFVSDGSTATEEETAGWIEPSIRRSACDGFDKRTVARAEDGAALEWCGIAARRMRFAYERDADSHGRTVELLALEA